MNWDRKICRSDNTFTVTNIHMDQTFNPSYSDTSSPKFTRLCQLVEKHLMTSYSLETDVIKGVKVIAARKGSVILDVRFLHASTVTPREAFKSFIAAIMKKSERNDKLLRIKTHIRPSMRHPASEDDSEMTTVLLVVAVVAFVVVMVVVSGYFFVRRRNAWKPDEKKACPSGYDNMAVQMK